MRVCYQRGLPPLFFIEIYFFLFIYFIIEGFPKMAYVYFQVVLPSTEDEILPSVLSPAAPPNPGPRSGRS